MKRILFGIATTIFMHTSFSQVVISTNPAATPDGSAMLEVRSDKKGFLMPRIPARTDVLTPATGVMIYEIATNSVLVYNGSSWSQLGSAGGASQWLTNAANIYNGNTGNVGIGTNTPTAKLHLAGLMKIVGGQIDIDDNVAQVRLLHNASPKGYFSLTSSTGDIQIGTYVTANDVGKLQLETKSFPRLTILPDGNVGIGHINPPDKLYVNGNIRTTARLDADGVIEGAGLSSTGSLYVNGTSLLGGALTASAAATVYGLLTTNTGVTINDAAGTLNFKTGGDDKAFVQLNGDDLRLGTYSASNPTGSLRVRVNGLERMNITPEGTMNLINGVDAGLTSNGYLMLGSPSGSNLILDNNEIIARGANGVAGNLVLQHDGGTVRIGNVAVPAGFKFGINGKMLCEELRVKLSGNWPDYVFKTNYQLLPLSELKKFIDANNHLPNIPKASDVEANGMEVGEMQKKMMEKIEELTLYVIDLQKQLDELKQKNNIHK